MSFKHGWLHRWKWLVYSPSEDGAFCRYCSIFAGSSAGGKSSQPLGTLVKRAFRDWNKATETFKNHEGLEYHRRCRDAADRFRGVIVGEEKPVNVQVDTAASRRIEENRKLLTPIIQTVIFCGRQGLPLRGHRDSGRVMPTTELSQDPDSDQPILTELYCKRWKFPRIATITCAGWRRGLVKTSGKVRRKRLVHIQYNSK